MFLGHSLVFVGHRRPYEALIQSLDKYEMVINQKTAKAIGLTVPQPLSLADEMIE